MKMKGRVFYSSSSLSSSSSSSSLSLSLSLSLLLLLLFSSYLHHSLVEAVDPGYTNSFTLLTSQLTLYWKPAAPSDSSVSFAVEGTTTGYVAVGWTKGGGTTSLMYPADVVVGWVPSSGPAQVTPYKTSAHITPSPSSSLFINATSATEINGVTTIYFTRPVASGMYNLNNTSTYYVIGAYGTSDILQNHGNSQRTNPTSKISIDFFLTPTTPTTTTTPTPTPTTPTPTPTPTPTSPATIPQGYTFSKVLLPPNSLTLFWKPMTSTTDANISFALQGITQGFVAVGWSPSGNMFLADSVVGWVIPSGEAQVGAYYNSKWDTPDTSTTLTVSNVAGSEVNGITTVFFTRPVAQGTFPIDPNGLNGIIGAYGSVDALVYHDLGKTHSGKISVNFATGVSTTSATIENYLRTAHGVLMLLSWGIALPFGMFFARYFRHLPGAVWFHVHKYVQPLSYCVAIVALIIAFVMVGVGGGDHFRGGGWHGPLGLSVMILGLAQVVVALFRPHKEPGELMPSNKRIAFEYFHWWAGRCLIVCAIVNCFKGMVIVGVGKDEWLGGVVVLAVVTGVLLLASVVLQIMAIIHPEGKKIVPMFKIYSKVSSS